MGPNKDAERDQTALQKPFESLALITLVVARNTIWEMCKEIDEYVEMFRAKQAKKKVASPS